jgi:hypothetical protein
MALLQLTLRTPGSRNQTDPDTAIGVLHDEYPFFTLELLTKDGTMRAASVSGKSVRRATEVLGWLLLLLWVSRRSK